MIELYDQDRQEQNRQSSKGNQLKWRKGEYWYKADYLGYEGLAEYVVSHLLRYSNLKDDQFVLYDTEQIRYRSTTLLGCRSRNFLPAQFQLLTLERLFQNHFGERLYTSLFRINDEKERAQFLVNQVQNLTGISDYGTQLTAWITIDGFFLNEDRHTHNLAVIMTPDETYQLSPVFDHGGCLLSDTRMDYPLDRDIYHLMENAASKTFSSSFDRQIDIMEELYGQSLWFNFDKKTVDDILSEEPYYSQEVKNRVRDIIFYQMRKYPYLFKT